jgi:hypothetical protein
MIFRLALGFALAAMSALPFSVSGSATKTSHNQIRNGVIAYTVGNGEEHRFVVMTIRPDGTHNRTLLRPNRRSEGWT